MSLLALQTYNPAVDPEANQRILAQNFTMIQKAVNLKGTNLLFGNNSTTTQTLSGVANLNIFGSTALSFTSSGGLIIVFSRIDFTQGAAGSTSTTFKLMLDGVQVDAVKVGFASGTFDTCATILYCAAVGAGPHKLEIIGTPTGANSSLNAGGTSCLYVLELGQ